MVELAMVDTSATTTVTYRQACVRTHALPEHRRLLEGRRVSPGVHAVGKEHTRGRHGEPVCVRKQEHVIEA